VWRSAGWKVAARDLLDHGIILNKRDRKRLMSAYLLYNPEDRTHLELAKDTPAGRPQQSALELEARFNPWQDSAACTIGLQRQRRLKSYCFSDDQTLSVVILPRHGSGFLRGFSSVDESACNPKPKRLHQVAEILTDRGHNDLANASVEEGGKTGSASNPPSDPRVDSTGIHGFETG